MNPVKFTKQGVKNQKSHVIRDLIKKTDNNNTSQKGKKVMWDDENIKEKACSIKN